VVVLKEVRRQNNTKFKRNRYRYRNRPRSFFDHDNEYEDLEREKAAELGAGWMT
jgi:hypothetical protein